MWTCLHNSSSTLTGTHFSSSSSSGMTQDQLCLLLEANAFKAKTIDTKSVLPAGPVSTQHRTWEGACLEKYTRSRGAQGQYRGFSLIQYITREYLRDGQPRSPIKMQAQFLWNIRHREKPCNKSTIVELSAICLIIILSENQGSCPSPSRCCRGDELTEAILVLSYGCRTAMNLDEKSTHPTW